MPNKYIVKVNEQGSVEITAPGRTTTIYRIPYINLKKRQIGFVIKNQFIDYILIGKDTEGRDAIYVGKSINGLSNRPVAHEDKSAIWEYCFILTQVERLSFFNDGVVQYIENMLCSRIDELDRFCNTTITTNSNTTNSNEAEDCDEYLAEAYKMLYALGLDLKSGSDDAKAEEQEDEERSLSQKAAQRLIPDGVYYLNAMVKRHGRKISASMQVKDGQCTLLKGSDVVEETGSGFHPVDEENRSNAIIEDGKLAEDIALDSLSACGRFVRGGSCNGWQEWKDAEGRTIREIVDRPVRTKSSL